MVATACCHDDTLTPRTGLHGNAVCRRLSTEQLHLSNDIKDYHYVSQGKTTIPNVDDGEELTLTDVRPAFDPRTPVLRPCPDPPGPTRRDGQTRPEPQSGPNRIHSEPLGEMGDLQDRMAWVTLKVQRRSHRHEESH